MNQIARKRGQLLLMLQRNLLYSSISFGSVAIGQMLVLVVITRFYGVDGVGQFGLANSIVVPVIMFSSLRLRTILATDARKEYGFYDYIYLRIFLLIFSSGLLVSTLQFIATDRIHYELLVLILLAKISDSLSEIYHGFLQLNETMGASAASNATKMILSVSLFYIGLKSSGDLILSYSLVVFVAIFMFCVDAFYLTVIKGLVKRNLLAPVNKASLKKLAIISFPVGLVAFVNAATANLPVYVGGIMLDDGELGWLVILNLMLAIGVRFFASFANVIATRISILYSKSLHSDISKLLSGSHFFIIAITLVLLIIWHFAGELLLSLLFNKWDEYLVLCTYMIIVASGFNHASLLGRFLLIGLRRSRALMKIYAADFVVTLILTSFLMYEYKIYGAVLAILIARTIRYMMTYKYFGEIIVVTK